MAPPQGGAHGFPNTVGGTVFKLDTTGKETVLYRFTEGTDGALPEAGVIRDAAGNLYGTTAIGGDLNCDSPYGCGVVFKVTRDLLHLSELGGREFNDAVIPLDRINAVVIRVRTR